MRNDPEVRDHVRERYGAAALRVLQGGAASCCGPDEPDPITSDLYDDVQRDAVPADALRASLGCGNPTALAGLADGETVLDISTSSISGPRSPLHLRGWNWRRPWEAKRPTRLATFHARCTSPRR
jgi:hypothetical protein